MTCFIPDIRISGMLFYLDILDRIVKLPENKREELRALAAAITAEESSDNIFSHNWRGDAYTAGKS